MIDQADASSIATCATMVSALVLAQAVCDAGLSDEILQAVAAELRQRAD